MCCLVLLVVEKNCNSWCAECYCDFIFVLNYEELKLNDAEPNIEHSDVIQASGS
jgi:hypothetical protein